MNRKLLTGQIVIDEIMKCGITHIVWLPDAEARFMYGAMNSKPGLTLVPICREGEAMAIAAGLITGGKKTMILHQNTGFFESGDSVRGMGLDLQLPVLLLMGYVGWRQETSSTGLYFEPILDAWGIKHYLLETDNDVEKISMAYKEASETKRPVAVLIAMEYKSQPNQHVDTIKPGQTMMDSFEAEQVISRYRHDAIVVAATHTSSREWPQVSSNPDLDIVNLPSVMGKASSFGLGLALAAPTRKIIILDGDGALLMNLGSLVTIANKAPANLIHFVMENGVYRTTGGQPIPGAGKISFKGLAKESGYRQVYEFDRLDYLENSMEKIMNDAGPTFVCIKVKPLTEMSGFPLPKNGDAASLSRRFGKASQRSSG